MKRLTEFTILACKFLDESFFISYIVLVRLGCGREEKMYGEEEKN